MPLILLTNDDGIFAPGLRYLENAVSDLGEVWTIAPHVERSACSRAVTLHQPLRVKTLGPRRFAVDGTPTDCVLLAFRKFLDQKPDLVLSGINLGYNIGEDVDYSGTVAAAAEAALQGTPASMAISVKRNSNEETLTRAGGVVRQLSSQLLNNPLPQGTYLNINVPPQPTNEIRWTRQGNPLPTGFVETRVDPRGGEYYWISERPKENDPPPETDRGALQEGLISATLLTLQRSYNNSWKPPITRLSGISVDD